MMEREERKKIFLETVDAVMNGEYVNTKGESVKIPFSYTDAKDSMTIEDSVLYEAKINLYTGTLKRYDDATVDVVNEDCFNVAKKLKDQGMFPAVLNMASFRSPGGGVFGGAGAQEENLCRRSTLFKGIFRFDKDLAKKFGLRHTGKSYPLDMNFGAAYSPAVAVLRDTEDNGYAFLDEPFMVDVITLAGIKNPELNEDGNFTPMAERILRNKVDTILRLGVLWGNDALVLGALGCGAFHTPADKMAEIFRDEIFSNRYKGLFKNITFAILDDKNARRENNPEGNYAPFKRIIVGGKQESA